MSIEDALAQNTVMIVEDFEDSRRLLSFGLRQQGYRVVEAADGGEALEAVGRERPDLVIMDLSLPGLDGLSVVYRMREMDFMADVPIVACTAHSPEVHSAAARAVGCDEYVTKPVDIARLEELIVRLISERRVRRPRADARQAAKPMDSDELLAYIDGLLAGTTPPH